MTENPEDGAGAPAAVRWLAKAELALAGAILLVSLVLTLLTIVERNLGHSTGDWSLKLPELMLVWMTFVGMGALVTEHGHVAADMFVQKLPPAAQRWANTAWTVITAVTLAVILWGAVSIVRQQAAIGATDEELWDVSSALLLSVLPFGIALTILHLLVEVYLIWKPRGPR